MTHLQRLKKDLGNCDYSELNFQQVQALIGIEQTEQTKRLADAYEALLQFNIENMEISRRQSEELKDKISSLLTAIAEISKED